MPSNSSNDGRKVLLTLKSIEATIKYAIEWNQDITSVNDYYTSPTGMQLLTANCTLITAIGEGVNRINRVMPDFLESNFPNIPWLDIIGMRNRVAHGYFELDADVVFDAVKKDIPHLAAVIQHAIRLCDGF